MLPPFLSLLYYLVMALFALSLYFVMKKKVKIVKTILFTSMMVTGSGIIILIFTEHRLPLYGAFEATIYLIFVLTLMEILFWKDKEISIQLKSCGGTAVLSLCLLLYHITQPKEFNPDFFMYGNPWVNLFFNLRLTAAALFSRTALLYQMGIWGQNPTISTEADNGKIAIATDRKASMKTCSGAPSHDTGTPAVSPENNNQKIRKNQNLKQNIFFSNARTQLLVGLVVFLCSEWAGSWWCLNWLGDSWQWSKGFFKAAIVFMLVMLTCHLPPSLARNSWPKAMTGSLPAMFLMWTIFYH
jgi:hypothetical protein